MKSLDNNIKFGSAIEHGAAHAKDHLVQSRRSFLQTLGIAGLGSSIMLGGTPIKAFGGSPVLQSLMDLETDRVLVLIQLKGGVDGLNMVIPIQEQAYYDARPNLAISANDSIALNSEFNLHSALSGLQDLWGSGEMAIVNGSGYPDPNLSHFEAIKIYQSTDPSRLDLSGWVGRALDLEYPSYHSNTPDQPLALEISPTSSLLFEAGSGQMGVAIRDPEEFYRLAATGEIYSTTDVPNSAYGNELSFLRGLANSASTFAASIESAASNAPDVRDKYPDGELGEGLSQDSRLNALFTELGSSIKAFYTDLKASSLHGVSGLDQNVMTMSYSEFGRRLAENGSEGTDHGTVSPLMVFGGGGAINGGMYGSLPNLGNLDNRGNLRHTIDFREIYGTILGDWFGVSCTNTTEALNYSGDGVNLVNLPADGGGFACSLPVELTSFDVIDFGEGNINLRWTTLSELNNQGFEIEYLAVDAYEAEWTTLGWVDGQGTSSTETNYEFKTRINDRGLYRFRLKQLDFSGSFAYSHRIELNVDYPAAYFISEIFPNPVSRSARISFNANSDQRMVIEIYDQQGRLADIAFDQEVLADQRYTVEMDASKLASGIYLINVRGGDVFSDVRKMIVAK